MDNLEGLNNINGDAENNKPFKRVKFAVNRLVNCAIPLHLQVLNAHHERIKEFQAQEEWAQLHAEQVNASNTVRLLKSDVYELKTINSQIREEDAELFQQATEPATNAVLDALASFLEQYPHVMSSNPTYPHEFTSSLGTQDVPLLVCNTDEPASPDSGPQPVIDIRSQEELLAEPLKVQKRWVRLQTELSELHELFRKFASVVFSHKEQVDSIEDNVQQACDNVHEGTKHLRKAVIFQAAAFPATGAVIGGLLLGPVGAAVGFKLFGSVACALSGCALGYGAGYKIKQKRQKSCDIEMKALTYSSKSVSLSTPDIAQISELITENDSAIDSDTITRNSD